MMTKEEEGYLMLGILVGSLAALLIYAISVTLYWTSECCGYRDKMVIEYHCPIKEYERDLFRHVVEASGVTTNFSNRVYTMDKHGIKIRLTNPNDSAR